MEVTGLRATVPAAQPSEASGKEGQVPNTNGLSTSTK